MVLLTLEFLRQISQYYNFRIKLLEIDKAMENTIAFSRELMQAKSYRKICKVVQNQLPGFLGFDKC